MTLVPSLRNPGPALSNSFKSQVTPISLSFGQSYMKPIHITFPSMFCSQPLALASNCCPTSNKSLCPNHNGKNYQRTGHHLVIRRPSKFAVLGNITSTLTVSTLTRHSKIFFTGQFNKRRLCYKTLNRETTLGVCFQLIQQCVATLIGPAGPHLRGRTLKAD